MLTTAAELETVLDGAWAAFVAEHTDFGDESDGVRCPRPLGGQETRHLWE